MPTLVLGGGGYNVTSCLFVYIVVVNVVVWCCQRFAMSLVVGHMKLPCYWVLVYQTVCHFLHYYLMIQGGDDSNSIQQLL